MMIQRREKKLNVLFIWNSELDDDDDDEREERREINKNETFSMINHRYR